MSKSKKKSEKVVVDDDNEEGGAMEEKSDTSADSVMAMVAEANGFVMSGASIRALQVVTSNPPTTLKENGPKEAAAEVAVKALSLIKEADMSKVLNDFSEPQLDVVLKYVYYGLSTGLNSAVLLKWHGALVDKLGNGSILRVLTEKRVADNKQLA